MNLRTGHRVFVPRERQRAGDFQAFQRAVRSAYRGWHVALLLDEDPSHTAKGSVGLAEQLGIELLWLPKLNPMDTLWGQGKDVICADHQYESLEEQVNRFIGCLRGLTPREALQTAGIHAKGFWLRSALRKDFCRPA